MRVKINVLYWYCRESEGGMKGERRGALLVLGVLALSAAVLGGIYGPVRARNGCRDFRSPRLHQEFHAGSVGRAAEYAIPVDTDHALYDGAIPGMLRVLDPHSTFFDPRQYALLREDQRGKYYGVGMTVGPQDNHTVVLAPMPGSPAAKAGIRPGDIIRCGGRQVHGRIDHLGSGRLAQGAQRHDRACHHGARRLRAADCFHGYARRDSQAFGGRCL